MLRAPLSQGLFRRLRKGAIPIWCSTWSTLVAALQILRSWRI
jgi:hypothetical protein